MRFEELIDKVRELSPEDRARLAGYLRYLRLQEDPEYRAEIGKRLQRMEAGEFFTMEQVRAMGKRLENWSPAMEASLAETWNRPEEDKAWAYLQKRNQR